MATVVTPLTCLVQVIGKPKPSKHQEGQFYYPCLFLIDGIDDDAHKLWKNLSGDEVTLIQRGDRVQLVPAGKDKSGNDRHNIVLLAPATAPAAPQAPAAQPTEQGLTPDMKRQIASFVEEQASLLKFCRDTVIAKLGNLDEETIRCSTQALYITTTRKFQLDR